MDDKNINVINNIKINCNNKVKPTEKKSGVNIAIGIISTGVSIFNIDTSIKIDIKTPTSNTNTRVKVFSPVLPSFQGSLRASFTREPH